MERAPAPTYFFGTGAQALVTISACHVSFLSHVSFKQLSSSYLFTALEFRNDPDLTVMRVSDSRIEGARLH